MQITNWQMQIIAGGLMGSGYISNSKMPYMSMSESRNHEWLRYKSQEMESIGAETPLCLCDGVLKWRSRSGDMWNNYREMLYGDAGKKVEMATLDGLRDIALAVWFGDKGFWYSRYLVGLRTSKFGEYNRIIVDYFREVGMPCDVKIGAKGTRRIVFSRQGTQKFLSTIAHRLPDFMHHRLDYRNG